MHHAAYNHVCVCAYVSERKKQKEREGVTVVMKSLVGS